MIKLDFHPNIIKLSNITEDERTVIRTAFTYPVPDAFHIKRNHKRTHQRYVPSCYMCNWDGNACLYKKDTLPIGFTDRLIVLLDESNIEYETKWHRVLPEKMFDWSYNFELRDYQKDALQAMFNRESGIVSAATGSGKTKLAAAAVCEFGVPSIIICPTKVVFGQFLKEFRDNTDIPVGEIGSGKWEDIAPVHIAIMATLAKYTERTEQLLSNKKLMLVDEYHVSASKSWQEVINTCPAYYRFGLSATPFRANALEDQYLAGLCGDVIYEINTEDLQEDGYLSNSDIRMVQIPCYPPANVFDESINPETKAIVGWRKALFADHYRDCIALNGERNQAVAEIVNKYANEGNKVLVIVAWKEQANMLIPIFEQEAIFLSGSDTKKNVEKKRQAFIERSGGICIGTSVVDVGLDVPAVDVLVIAAGGEYKGRTQQRLGRGLRPSPGKDKVLVFDFYDMDTSRKKHFLNHSKSRFATYEGLGQKPVVYKSLKEALEA